MIKMLYVSVIALSALTASNSAFAQSNTSSVAASGSVTLIRPLTITKNADLNFGRIVKPASGTGTVTMANTSDTAVAAVGAVALAGISTSRAKFTINGEGGQVVNVTVPANVVISDGTPADNITVTLNPDLGASVTLSNALAAAGSASLNIGGNLSVPNANSTGLYTGSFTVTVAYN
jgi:hypothetical protein